MALLTPDATATESHHCLLISLDPAAHLCMELHYSCGAWHLIPDRSSERPASEARDRRPSSQFRPARILSLRPPPNRPPIESKPTKTPGIQSGCGPARERAGGRTGWHGGGGIDPKAPPPPRWKKSNSQRATFSVLMSTIGGGSRVRAVITQ